MAKLYYKFGAMGSSKTAQALITKFNYEEKGMRVLFIKPKTDNRDGADIVKSRIGLSAKAVVVDEKTDISKLFQSVEKHDVVIVDECQFLTPKQIKELKYISSYLDVPVLCFGLRTDFKCKLFPGSKALFELADSIAEIKSICRCGNKAIINARLDETGKIVTEGEQVEIGGNEKYEAVCWKCYNDMLMQQDK